MPNINQHGQSLAQASLLDGDMVVVSVLVPIPAHTPYSYKAPSQWHLNPGDIVQVPIGSRKVMGVVWDPSQSEKTDTNKLHETGKLREVEKKFDCPPMTQDMRRFIEWVANYTISSPGMVMKMALRNPAALEPEAPIPALVYNGQSPDRNTPARAKILDILKANEQKPWIKSDLAKQAGVSTSVVDGLIKLDIFDKASLPPPELFTAPNPNFLKPKFSEDQQTASQRLIDAVCAEKFSANLLDGVTGSGKTEVYLESVAAAIDQGKQVLIMIPEIALTSAFLDRFEKRFGVSPAPWHSELSPRIRERIWRQTAEGKIRVVAGARSALYLPFSQLGLIVVDEEHDTAYKQEDRVSYNGRDMAVVRASIGNFPIVLASATPSLESHINAQNGRYNYIPLKERHGNAKLPDISIIDLRKDKPSKGNFISPELLSSVAQTLARNEQALLFLNRRGYAPLTLCRACGHRFECKQCTAWLVEHRFRNSLNCHHCGHHEPSPDSCPNCGALDFLVPCGPGIERLAEEVEQHFPDARSIILSSDLTGGPKRLRDELRAVEGGQVDIIIGTQLVAKGHNFPKLTLVGIVDADLGLSGGDPRAAERSFQLLSQVTGRAGRFGQKSAAILQSYQPEHPVMQALANGDRDGFYEVEILSRQRGMLPPFGRLASLIISANSKNEAQAHAKVVTRYAKPDAQIAVLGPAEAPMAVIRGRHRQRILFHAQRSADLQGYIRQLIEEAPKPKGSVRIHIDVDPQSFV